MTTATNVCEACGAKLEPASPACPACGKLTGIPLKTKTGATLTVATGVFAGIFVGLFLAAVFYGGSILFELGGCNMRGPLHITLAVSAAFVLAMLVAGIFTVRRKNVSLGVFFLTAGTAFLLPVSPCAYAMLNPC